MTELFGSLPPGWSVTRVDRVATVNARIGWKALTADEYVPDGYAFLATPNIKSGNIDFDNVNYITEHRYLESPPLQLHLGDVLLTKDGSTLGICNVVTHLPRPATINGSIAVIRPFSIEPRYLRYSLASEPIQGLINSVKDGMGVPHLFQRDINRLPLPTPPLSEQNRIADFLDAETRASDALAAGRRRQRELLEEREISLIQETLTGVDVTGPRQRTGLKWMPRLPSGWNIAPVYAYFDVRLGKMLNPERARGASLKPYLRNANIHWDSIQTDDLAEMSFGPLERARYSVSVGDLLICEGGAGVAEAAVWSDSSREIFFQKSLHRCRPTSTLPAEWMLYWLRLAKHTGVFAAEGNLATIPHLTGEQLRSHRIPVAPDAQQRIQSLRVAVDKLQYARAALDASDRLVKERRSVLITAAVTGQLDVTTAQGPPL